MILAFSYYITTRVLLSLRYIVGFIYYSFYGV